MVALKLSNVHYDIDLTTKRNKDLGDDCRGITRFEELKILLNQDMPKELIIQTMYHEIAHAMCEETSFNDMLMDKLGDNGYEIFVDMMGRLLYDIIHNNDMKKIEENIMK